jgi:oligosaccharide reducing-end xylanase
MSLSISRKKRLVVLSIILSISFILVLWGIYSLNDSANKSVPLFAEIGVTKEQWDSRIQKAFEQFFYGDAEQEKVYYEVGSDEAYILDVGDQDVRTEGMSYGMMLSVQMNKQMEFNRLWTWAKKHMQHSEGEFKGYFSWHNNIQGEPIDKNPASDGEEYFATALMLASERWGDGKGIYNYKKEAQDIFYTMLHQKDNSQGINLFNAEEKQVVFVPSRSGSTFTDPSYHLPAFYERWAQWDPSNANFWKDAAKASRELWVHAANPDTGLMADYTRFDGIPYINQGHEHFFADAYRVAMNMALDWHTTHADPRQRELLTRYQDFFAKEGIDQYGGKYSLAGKKLEDYHPIGLVGMNAVASLASTHKQRLDFVKALWDTSLPTGQYRYYDGFLYMFAMLICSDNYHIQYK